MTGWGEWDERLRRIRPVFEVAGFALTTVTWTSLCMVGSYIVLRGYTTLSPALAEMGWQGLAIYSIFAVPFTAVALISSLVLILAFWSLVLQLKWDIEYGPNFWMAFLVGALSKLWHYGFAGFLVILTAVLSIQILIALGLMTSPYVK